MRRAFVMGSNGPADNDLSPLQYARQDAERMKACLSGARCGFVVDMPLPGADAFEVRRQLTSVAESCTSEDTFVCYFSGHGILEKGALFLLWENTQLDRLLSTALPISDIMQVLKYCKASSRLLILDCCHAGTVATMLGLKDAAGVPVQELEIIPDNYFVLMASDRLERARELETLQGSFLTANIAEALEGKFSEADKDEDGRLSMQDLHQWLEERAKNHNRLSPSTRVSYPYLLGKQKGAFYLTLAASAWVPYEIDWPDGSILVVLPFSLAFLGGRVYEELMLRIDIRSFGPVAICLGKYPITNAQYKRFVEDKRGQEPVGKHYITGPLVVALKAELADVQNMKEAAANTEDYERAAQYRLQELVTLGKLEKALPNETMQHAILEQKNIGFWQDHFYPWRTEGFRDPEKPVVCVSYYEAHQYCQWVNKLHAQAEAYTFLPHSELWDLAAFRTAFPSYNPDTMFTRYQSVHHKASVPAAIDRTGARSNDLGISDLLGNIWEWCEKGNPALDATLSSSGWPREEHELRGGGFLDDLSRVRPALSSGILANGADTRHSDLGFRIAAILPLKDLPEEVQRRLPARSNRR